MSFTLTLSLSLQVEVKKAEPRYATASAAAFQNNMAAYGANAGASNYGGKDKYVPPHWGVHLMACIVFLLVLLCL